jgi:hypothetical protein
MENNVLHVLHPPENDTANVILPSLKYPPGMRAYVGTILLLGLAISSQAVATRFDHFNIVVLDLEQTISTMEAMGFKVKRSKPHGNGILNAFIKMKDRTYIEFISVQEPTDELARHFVKMFKEKGESGVFISFERSPLNEAKEMVLNRGKYFSTLGYPLQHKLSAYFLIDYHSPPDDSAFVDHENGITGTIALLGASLPITPKLDSQFLPLDSRVHLNGEKASLVTEITFSRKCDSPKKFTPFERFGIRFVAEKQGHCTRTQGHREKRNREGRLRQEDRG